VSLADIQTWPQAIAVAFVAVSIAAVAITFIRRMP